MAGDQRGHFRMIRRDDHEGGAVDGVGPGGEDADAAAERGDRKIDVGAEGTPDPVPLHDLHFFRPMLQLVESFVEPIGVVRDFQEPLLQFALLDWRAAAFAAPVDHLLVRQYSLITRAPVHRSLAAVRQSALVELEKQPLVPSVILGLTGRELFGPVVENSPSHELPLHLGDVADGPLVWMNAALDRRVFRGKSESVPPHRIQCSAAAHLEKSIERIPQDVVAPVSDVKIAGGIGKHVEHVVLVARPVEIHFGHTGLGPGFLPLGFDLFRFVRHKKSGSITV